jgi:hypothetical protein
MISTPHLGQAQAESFIQVPQTQIISQDSLNLFEDDFPTKPIMPSRPLFPGHLEVQAAHADLPANLFDMARLSKKEDMDEKVYSHPRVQKIINKNAKDFGKDIISNLPEPDGLKTLEDDLIDDFDPLFGGVE